MSIAYWCILLAALLPYACAGLAKSEPGFDNRRPREWLRERTGWRKRADAAQQNSFEVFPPFAIAVVIAQQLDGASLLIDALAVAFIVLRIAYVACYVADRATLRSLIWSAGLLCVIGLFLIAAL